MNTTLKIISLGGFGNVTKNMYVYETENDILLVDCGVGFPDDSMLGIDLVIPDVSYLQTRMHKVKGLVFSHGHEDHIGATPYILPKLPVDLPMYAPRWAKALIETKLKEFELPGKVNLVEEGNEVTVGEYKINFIKVTHSIPDTMHLVIKTPVGTIYHAADFKLDLKPVMGEPTNQELIRAVGRQGILCLLSDSLRVENPGFTPPEYKLQEMFEEQIQDCPGKLLVTTMSSNISRFKQAIDVSLNHGRKIVLIGRSVDQNVQLAQDLGYYAYPPDIFVDKRSLAQFTDDQLTFLVAGSQGQLGSAMDKIAAGEYETLKIKKGDKVVFSTDYIPGNETAIYGLIDNLYRLGAEVVYSNINDNVHVSGHGSQGDLGKLMEMVNPRYLLPIGGQFRHMVGYQKLAVKNGFKAEQVILADGGQVTQFDQNGLVKTDEYIHTGQIMIDALGVGDVGNVVLRDRQILSEEGVVVVILPLSSDTHQLEGEPEIITRGFVYVKENNDLIYEATNRIRKEIHQTKDHRVGNRMVRVKVQTVVEEFFYQKTGRRPMVLVVVIEN